MRTDLRRPAPALLGTIGVLARLGLAAVWLVSGGMKVADPGQFYAAVQAYQLFGPGLTGLLAAVVPFVEVALGVLLVAGLGIRPVAVLSALLLVAYIAGVAQSWARGLSIDCGCFGGGGQVAQGQTRYGLEILRDLGFLVPAGWLVVRPATPLSLDGRLAGPASEDVHDPKGNDELD
jgi:uncharacterized membrane protein YphA (DoxX/SURF4 family)